MHSPQIISRSVIADSGLARLAVGHEIRPRVGGGFLLHQPKILHAWKKLANFDGEQNKERRFPNRRGDLEIAFP
jgi:hypothetical protein